MIASKAATSAELMKARGFIGRSVARFRRSGKRKTRYCSHFGYKRAILVAFSRHVAFIMSLSPGSYTAILTGANGTTGAGLIEIYDLDSSGPLLFNVSTRGLSEMTTTC